MTLRSSSALSNRWLKIFGWSAAVFALLLLAVFVGAKMWIDSYLRGAAFRKQLEERVSEHMRAQVDIAPVTFDSSQFFCDGLSAKGGQEAKFSDVKIENVRGEFKLPGIWRLLFGDKKFRVEGVDVQRVEANFFDDRLSLTLPPLKQDEKMTEVGRIGVREVKIGWPGGSISGLGVTATKSDAGWQINGAGGQAAETGLPTMDIVSLRALHKEPSLFIQEARLREAGGEIGITGEVTEKEKVDLQFKVAGVSVTPLLPEDWRARLHGRVFGDARLVVPTRDGPGAPAVVTGSAQLKDGKLEALPVLNKIADFTRTDQFRQIELKEVRGDFRYDRAGLRITNFVLESERLIAVRGQFTVADGQIDGSFEIGITPGPLQWLPGSQEKVFTSMHDGYAWTHMHIAGPVRSPREDLSSRLAAAAQNAVIEKVESTATQAVGGAVNQVKKSAAGVLDLLFGN